MDSPVKQQLTVCDRVYVFYVTCVSL